MGVLLGEGKIILELSPWREETLIEGLTCFGQIMPTFLVCEGCHNKLGDLNNRHLFSHRSGGKKPKIKVLADLVSFEAFLIGLQMATFLL